MIYKNSVSHLSSVHNRYDTRIFYKMCISAANNGFKTSLIVSDNLGYEYKNNVEIHDVNYTTSSKISRMIISTFKVYRKALSLNSDIYHLHDPELIPIGILLKLHGKKVIFDAHEDLPKQILAKPYLNIFSKFILSRFFSFFEWIFCRWFDYIITATPYLKNKFLKINKDSIDINNYPLLTEFSVTKELHYNRKDIVYVGSISKFRGVKEVVKSLDYIDDVKLNLVGSFSESSFHDEIKVIPSWKHVNELGFLNRTDVSNIMSESIAGLVTLHPCINYLDALPVKMFEYMAAGLPVICSDFPLWKDIIKSSNCGLCVDPLSPTEISDAIISLKENPELVKVMGDNGKKAVEEKYNWSFEESKLLHVYLSLC